MDLPKRIKSRREELGLSQEELAKALGYKSRSTINKIELGINDITQSKIEAFAKALQTTPAYLMGWKESATPEEKPDDVKLDENIIIYNRNGEVIRKKFTKEQMNYLEKFINSIGDNDCDL